MAQGAHTARAPGRPPKIFVVTPWCKLAAPLVLAMRHVHGLGWGGALWRGVVITLLDGLFMTFFFGMAAGGIEANLTM